jgi:hypothetical protein
MMAVRWFAPAPEPDWAAIYNERYWVLAPSVCSEEAAARAYDFTVLACRTQTHRDLEEAKKVVLAAIGRRP